MATNLNKKTVEELTHDLVFEKINVNEITLTQKKQREAFFNAVKERPNILTKVNSENARHFLVPAIEENPAYFVYLKREQYTDELATIYLSYRLSLRKDGREDFSEQTSKWFTTHTSVDGKVVLNYNYVTPNGEELYYFDNELQVPSALKSNFKISLKIKNALTFIEQIDMHVTELGKRKVESIIADVLDNQYRSMLGNYINKKKIGFYTLSTSINDFEGELQDKLANVYKSYGIEVVDVIIRRFAIPKEIQEKIEDQAFELRQIRADMNASHELAKKSLENYEAKLAIENKYPNGEHTLTEYEKDLAVKRYLIKTGRQSKENIDRSILIGRQVEEKDRIIDKESDIIPEIPPKKNVFKNTFITLLIVSLFINLIVLTSSVGGGLIYLGLNCLIFGCVAAVYSDKFKNEEVKIDYDDEDQEEYIENDQLDNGEDE